MPKDPFKGLDREPEGPSELNTKAIIAFALGWLALTCSIVAGVPAIILGIMALRDIKKYRRQRGLGLALGGIIGGAFFSIIPLIIACPIIIGVSGAIGSLTGKAKNKEKLRTITEALLEYDKQTGALPPAAICDARGNKRLSWRVALLPYLGEKKLYDDFKLDEDWSSAHNKKLLSRMPRVYENGDRQKASQGRTPFVVIVQMGAAFEPGSKGVPVSSFTDGLDTILVTEKSSDVAWTEPEDLAYWKISKEQKDPMRFIRGSAGDGTMNFGLANGEVRTVKMPNLTQKSFEAALSRKAGDAVGPDW